MACGLYLAAEVELAAFARPLAERRSKRSQCSRRSRAASPKSMLRHGLDYVLKRGSFDMPHRRSTQSLVRAFLGASL